MKKKLAYAVLTTANLGISGVFTGPAMDVEAFGDNLTGFYYTKLSVLAFANQASAANGFQIQGSNDSATWFVVAQATTTASTASLQEVPLVFRYYRVVYTNAGVAQTSFTLNRAFL